MERQNIFNWMVASASSN